MTVAGRRFYPIQVAEKGFAAYRIAIRGTWGHGSMPRDDNAAVLAAAVIERLAVPGPVRLTPVMARFLDLVAAELPPEVAPILAGLAGDDPRSRGGGARDGLRPDGRAGGPRPASRHDQPGCRPRRGQVQRHPRRRDRRGRLPRPARHVRAGDARRAGGAARPGAGRRVRDRADGLRCPGRVARRGRAVRPPRRHDPRPRSGRHPAPGHRPRSPPMPSTPTPSGHRPTGSRRSGWSPRSTSSIGSTASTSGSRSTPCAGGCRSCTTWSAASAADKGRSDGLAFRVRRRLDEDLLTARRADIDPAGSPAALGIDVRGIVRGRAARAGSTSRPNGDAGAAVPAPTSERDPCGRPPRAVVRSLLRHGADEPAAATDRVGRQGRDTHGHDGALGNRQRPDR